MEVYGLTGGIGSGKSTVAELLEDYGIPVVSADELSRMVVAPGSPGLADVVEAFGAEVLDDRGELDRKKMGQIVFTTPERRRQLEAILHPRIRERYEQVLDALEKAGHPVMVYEVPLLFEKKLDQQDEMKGVILVTASTDTRIARVKSRDTLTTDEVLARMRAQMPEADKRARADYIIHNDGDHDDLRREVEHLISRFLRLPPRADEAALAAALAVEPEPELEIDESEIDTLSPEEIHEEPTARLELDPIAAEVSLAISNAAASEALAELEVELSPPPPPAGSGPVRSAAPPNEPSRAETAPQAPAPPAPTAGDPAVAAAGPRPDTSAPDASISRPARARLATAPQVAIPFVREKQAATPAVAPPPSVAPPATPMTPETSPEETPT